MLFRRPLLASKVFHLWNVSLLRCRRLHIQGEEAVKFLINRGVPASRIFPVRSRTLQKGSTPRTILSFLLHADRRPQTLVVKHEIVTRSKKSYKTERSRTEHLFFGPSLLGAMRKSLKYTDENGPGGLGLLKKQKDSTNEVLQYTFTQKKGLDLKTTRDFIMELAPNANNGMHHPHNKNPLKRIIDVLHTMWSVFKECEGVWFTFELVIIREDIYLHAPYLDFDDFAVHRVKALKEVSAKVKAERDSNTASAEDGGLFYIKLANGGKVGSFGYGAGNAMATIDGLAMAGATPANFLDGGGDANVANAKLAIETLHRDSDVKSIFVNTFGGLTRCSLVAEGIIEAVKENNIKTPITVRVMGTEAKEAKELFRSSGLPFTLEDNFKKAAELAVSQAGPIEPKIEEPTQASTDTTSTTTTSPTST